MDRFVSNYRKKIDGKGRVSVPPQFRAVLTRLGDDQLYTRLCLETPSIMAGGAALMAQFEARLEAMDPFSRDYDDWAALCYADSEFLKIDNEGRVVITDTMRDYAGIKDEIAFAGRGLSFHLWNPDAFEAHMSAVRTRILDKRAGEPR